MNILITGGCGFIGLNLIEYFQKKTSHHLIVLDNEILGKRSYLNKFDVEFIPGDIREKNTIASVMKKTDAVVHLAADTQVICSIENPGFNYDVNVNGTFNLLNCARAENVERFVFASTGGAIVGDVLPPVNENMVPKPVSPYGASKLCGEAYCSAFAKSYGMKTVSLRFSNVYGPQSFHKGSVIALFFKQILRRETLVIYGDGRQTRDFVYVSDLCSPIHKSLSVEKGGLTFQLGTGAETSIKTLVNIMQKIIANDYPLSTQSLPARPGEVLRNCSEILRSKNHIQVCCKPASKVVDGV